MTTSNPCTKAIIAVAGFGTRRLPITKAVEKCLLPVGNRPIVDYVVEDCVKAGITDIIFVVGEQSEQIRTYYGHNPKLERYLADSGKQAALAETNAPADKARFSFVVQDTDQPYGTSTPMWLAREHIRPDETFLYLYGDNIFFNEDGTSAVAAFLAAAAATATPAAMLAVPVPDDQVGKYGIVAVRKQAGVELYERIVEKPKIGEAPSNLNNAGCFLMNPDVLPFIAKSMEHSPQAEKYVTDAVNWYSEAGNAVAVVRLKGEYLDCGTVDGWLHANNRIIGAQTV